MSVSARLEALGLEAPLSTKVTEQNEQRAAERALAEVDMRRARARAGRLERRAAREAINSNGRAKHLAQAKQLRAHVRHLASTYGLEDQA